MSQQLPSSSPHQPSSLRIESTSTTTSTITSTIIITNPHHHPFQAHQGLTKNHSSLTRRHPSSPTTVRLTPLLTLAAYGSIIIAAFSALFGLTLASYGLSAWGDVKGRFIGARGVIGKRLEAEKEITSEASPKTEHGATRHIARRPEPCRSSSSFDQKFDLGNSSTFSFPRTVHDGPMEDHEDINLTISSEGLRRKKHNRSRSLIDYRTQSANPLPRPTLSILIASLFFTLIVVAGRLMVAWWMGQQAQKNPTQAFRNAQRAYEAAQEEEEEEEDSRLPSSVYPSSSVKHIKNKDSFSAISF